MKMPIYFEFAKEQLRDLSIQEEPFNLTMLTVDTHFEDGYVCEKCEDTHGDDQYANVMACSSKQIEDLSSGSRNRIFMRIQQSCWRGII